MSGVEKKGNNASFPVNATTMTPAEQASGRVRDEEEFVRPMHLLEGAKDLCLLRAGVLVTLIFAGCNDDGPAGPDLNNILDGRWDYSIASHERPDGRSCSTSGAVLDLEQDGAFFSGTITVGTTTCVGPEGDEMFPEDFFDGVVNNGRFDGDSVFFELIGDDWIHRGMLDGDRIEGSVRIGLDPEIVTSTFEAVRIDE
ncbi:MAG: hypothetical protein ACREMK_04650 [Gemmatimonadota bacterium]